ncbi:hypothetical protein DIPPA_17797 [Diplonema papillatum]|nr:hypothetical protein DIPPA_17797 [Diplonema papillatum]KAJ9457646.1 hypothetical protein DIPPA_17797 [Diplonema papillatum]|eukprot:gene7627-11682_t
MTYIDLTLPGKGRVVQFDMSKQPIMGWTQTEEVLCVLVRVASAKDAKVKVEKRKLTITVEGPDGQKYKAELPLDGTVETDDGTWSVQIRRLSVKVQVKKSKYSQEEWDRLVNLPVKDTKNWLEYDWDAHDDVEVDDVEPDEKEQPDEEPKKKRAPDETGKPAETKQQKQDRWSAAQEKIRTEAEAAAKVAKKRSAPPPAPLQFTFSQLFILLLFTVLLTALTTYLFTTWALLPRPSFIRRGEL